MVYLRFIDKCSREFELGYEISFRDCFDNGLVDSGSKVHLLACPLIIPTPKSPNDTRTTSTLTCNSKFEVRSFFTISVLFLVLRCVVSISPWLFLDSAGSGCCGKKVASR